MKRIFKYTLTLDFDRQSLFLHEGARILAIQEQDNKIALWVSSDEGEPLEERFFLIVGTGHYIPDEATRYVGTVQIRPFVWHIYEDDNG